MVPGETEERSSDEAVSDAALGRSLSLAPTIQDDAEVSAGKPQCKIVNPGLN